MFQGFTHHAVVINNSTCLTGTFNHKVLYNCLSSPASPSTPTSVIPPFLTPSYTPTLLHSHSHSLNSQLSTLKSSPHTTKPNHQTHRFKLPSKRFHTYHTNTCKFQRHLTPNPVATPPPRRKTRHFSKPHKTPPSAETLLRNVFFLIILIVSKTTITHRAKHRARKRSK